jgi:hypothetical protein
MDPNTEPFRQTLNWTASFIVTKDNLKRVWACSLPGTSARAAPAAAAAAGEEPLSR